MITVLTTPRLNLRAFSVLQPRLEPCVLVFLVDGLTVIKATELLCLRLVLKAYNYSMPSFVAVVQNLMGTQAQRREQQWQIKHYYSCAIKGVGSARERRDFVDANDRAR
ncbi:hypothetical protein PINS_up003253 [Pythium insidiosum]|nr:hypothetical protein PINS_up003253 [Pythium insidiosum]